MIVAIGTTGLLKVFGLRLRRTDVEPAAVSSVTAKILDSAGNTVAGSEITLTVDGTDTDTYWGEFPGTLSLTAGAEYTVEVVVVADAKRYTARRVVPAGYLKF